MDIALHDHHRGSPRSLVSSRYVSQLGQSAAAGPNRTIDKHWRLRPVRLFISGAKGAVRSCSHATRFLLTNVNRVHRLERLSYRFSLLLGKLGPVETAAGVATGGASRGTRLSYRDGVPVAQMERSAATLADAVLDAIRELEAASPGWRVVRVEPDELVSATAIARRLGRTRQSVAQLIAGQRGSGDFPPPAVWVEGAARLWRWSDVAEWFSPTVKPPIRVDRLAAEFLAMINGELEARRHRERLALLTAPGIEPGSERFAVEAAFPQLGSGRRWRGAAAELGGSIVPSGRQSSTHIQPDR